MGAASYFVLVATFAALAGQHVVRRVIAILGRTSIIIFILALTIFVSAISLGKSQSPLLIIIQVQFHEDSNVNGNGFSLVGFVAN